jgi:hypothetical protein
MGNPILTKIEQVRANFFFPQVFLCEPEPAEIFGTKKKAGSRISSSAYLFFI